MTQYNAASPAVIVWTVDGIEHDRVEHFYADPDTGATTVQCYHECCCRKAR